jgi:hypothetical protein
MITVREVGSVAHQSAGFDKLTNPISCRNPVARRQGGKLDSAAEEECLAANEEGVGVVARERVKGRLDLAAGTGVEDLNLQPKSACSCGYIS